MYELNFLFHKKHILKDSKIGAPASNPPVIQINQAVLIVSIEIFCESVTQRLAKTKI